jgi:hypothetical protein
MKTDGSKNSSLLRGSLKSKKDFWMLFFSFKANELKEFECK